VLFETIQAELVRLQLHPVNLSVCPKEDRFVELRGSLLQYWKFPRVVDGPWFLGVVEGLPDASGPGVVMDALVKAWSNQAAAPI